MPQINTNLTQANLFKWTQPQILQAKHQVYIKQSLQSKEPLIYQSLYGILQQLASPTSRTSWAFCIAGLTHRAISRLRHIALYFS